MTEKQIWKEEDAIYDTVGGRHEYFCGERTGELTPEQKHRLEELSCMRMIDSILAYTCKGMRDAKSVLEREKNSYKNYLEEYIEKLGEDRVLELIQGQIDSIADVRFGGYDGEGNWYNTVIYKESEIDIAAFVHEVVKEWDWTMPKYDSNEFGDYNEYECYCLDIGHDNEMDVAEIVVERIKKSKSIPDGWVEEHADEISELVWDKISAAILANMDKVSV